MHSLKCYSHFWHDRNIPSYPALHFENHQARCQWARHLQSSSALCWRKQLKEFVELHPSIFLLILGFHGSVQRQDDTMDELPVHCEATPEGKQPLKLHTYVQFRSFQFHSNMCFWAKGAECGTWLVKKRGKLPGEVGESENKKTGRRGMWHMALLH